MTDLTAIRVPRKFFEDHESRELPTPVVLRRTSRHVFVMADDPEIDELRSDADYYSDPAGFDPCYRGLCASARATVQAIDRARRDS